MDNEIELKKAIFIYIEKKKLLSRMLLLELVIILELGFSCKNDPCAASVDHDPINAVTMTR